MHTQRKFLPPCIFSAVLSSLFSFFFFFCTNFLNKAYTSQRTQFSDLRNCMDENVRNLISVNFLPRYFLYIFKFWRVFEIQPRFDPIVLKFFHFSRCSWYYSSPNKKKKYQIFFWSNTKVKFENLQRTKCHKFVSSYAIRPWRYIRYKDNLYAIT